MKNFISSFPIVLLFSGLIFAQEYSPEIYYNLDPVEPNSVSDLNITVTQAPHEIDTEKFIIDIDGGYFDFSGLQIYQEISQGYAVFTDEGCDEAYANGEGQLGPGYTCPPSMDTELLVRMYVYYLDLPHNEVAFAIQITASNNDEYLVEYNPAGLLMNNIVEGGNIVGVRMEVAYFRPDQGHTTQGYLSYLEIPGIYNTPFSGPLHFDCEFYPEIGPTIWDYQVFNYDNPLPTGDLNGDGSVDVVDIVLIVQYILGNITLTPSQIAIADVNVDGIIDIIDVVTWVQIIVDGA